MRKRILRNRIIAGTLTTVMVAANITMTDLPVEAAVNGTSTLTVDMSAQTGDILHGASGFLYGISNEDVPTTNTLVPLKPKVLATKGALGTEHPYGDALDVAETFLQSGGEMVMMYNSNYYGVFGVTADYRDYSEVLEHTIAPYVYEWKQGWKAEHGTPDTPKDELGKVDIDAAIVYIPINEGTPVNGAANSNIAWESYYDAIKKGDPDAAIAGPNSASYNEQFVNTDFRGYVQYCVDHDCMPDVITWHELSSNCLVGMSEHMEDFRDIWDHIDWTKWLETHEEKLDMPQIVINEYAEMKDCGVPGALVNWIARLEDEKIYGCLPFWQQANNLNGLTSDANEGAGAWWVYKWYGDMSGKTLKVDTTTSYERLYGVAAIDDKKQSASVLMGGEDGNQKLVMKNLVKTETFQNEKKVHIAVQKADYNGYAGTVSEVPTVLEGTFPIAADGSVEITVPNAKYADAFYITVTKAGKDAGIDDPIVNRYSATYEAEKAQFSDLTIKKRADYEPTYYFSDGYAVLMDEADSELTYEISVPVDGKYKLNFLYGNGTGSSRNNMNTHKPLNVKQHYRIDGGEAETVIMENTLFTAITDCYTMYADLKAGKHTITIKSLEDADVIHDALTVTYSGAYGVDRSTWRTIYEAESADFNTLADCKVSSIVTETEKSGYSGNGYVTGLNKTSVAKGGGVRWNVVVEESGIYNFMLCYQTTVEGNANIYVGNTTTELNSLCKTLKLTKTEDTWNTVMASIYLQKGINIVDVDADIDAALDYLKVQRVPENVLEEGTAVVIEAEACIPEGSSIEVKNSKGASAGKYVVGFEGDENAALDKNKYLEFTYDAPQEGIYELQVFQSNDDICGTHWYNIKIIDKYATIQVQNEAGKVIGENRYFFINTSSDDTFKEKTVKVYLEKGKNTLKIFNDDSWHVTWGGTTSTPGLNELDNYTPNFDKFVLTPMTLETTAKLDKTYQIQIQTTAGGYAVADKNETPSGGDFVVTLLPEKGVKRVLVNGEDQTEKLAEKDGNLMLALTDVQADQRVAVYFIEGSGEYRDPYIVNASFGEKDLTGWEANASSTMVNNLSSDSLEGYYVQISEGTLKQKVTGIPAGEYNLCVYSKAKDGVSVSGQAVLKVQGQENMLAAGASYKENVIRVLVDEEGTLTIEVDATGLQGTLCMDRFALEKTAERDATNMDEMLSYFVDCGDHNPETLSGGDLFGRNNSVTDRYYGTDKVTGYSWGVVTTEDDYAINRGSDEGVYTVYQWANENQVADGLSKTTSFRYAHGQDTAGIDPRYIKYRFELEPGEYTVSVCMGNTWNNAGKPQIYLNDTKITDDSFSVAVNSNTVVSENIDLSQAEKNEKGYVTLDIIAQSTEPTIQMNYITIAPYREYADTGALRELYDSVKDTKNEGYTRSSWEAFQNELGKAGKLLEEGELAFDRQSEVNNTRRALNDAWKALKLFADVQNPELLYFVDCGDHDPTTLTRQDKFGVNNSVTDQLYGADPETGKNWGVVISEKDTPISPAREGDKAVYTEFQRANQNNDSDVADGKNKKVTYRYAHSQKENNISPRYVKYQFELEPGTYEVEVCMGNNWGNSDNPDVYLNEVKINESALEIPQGGNKIVTGSIDITENETLLVAAYSQDDTINMNYIKIKAAGEKTQPADKSGLQETITKAESLNSEEYTEDSMSELKKVLEEAREMLGDTTLTDADQDRIDEMAERLQQAIEGLEKNVKKVTDIFVDVQIGDWFVDYVQYVYDQGIMTGMDATHFGPAVNLNRSQFATILYRMEGSPQVEYKGVFTDVADGEFYTDAVMWAGSEDVRVVTGYTVGENAGKFGPEDPLTREQMATMLYRYAQYKGYITEEFITDKMETFPDKDDVSEFAVPAVSWAVSEELIIGDNEMINPFGTASRVQCATIIQRFMEQYGR